MAKNPPGFKTLSASASADNNFDRSNKYAQNPKYTKSNVHASKGNLSAVPQVNLTLDLSNLSLPSATATFEGSSPSPRESKILQIASSFLPLLQPISSTYSMSFLNGSNCLHSSEISNGKCVCETPASDNADLFLEYHALASPP